MSITNKSVQDFLKPHYKSWLTATVEPLASEGHDP